MRPYRGKRKDNGEWVYGCCFEDKEQQEVYIALPQVVSHYADNACRPSINLIKVIPKTVGQSTGRKDYNGKESYHHDICVAHWPYAGKCTIEWDEKRCGFYFQPVKGDGLLGKAAYDKGYKMNANKFEIIGNKFDDPKLIEEIK